MNMVFVDNNDAEIIRDAVNRILNLRAGPGISIRNSPDGITISAIRAPQPPGFSAPTVEVISGLVTSNAAGNGKYNGKSFSDVTADVSASGNLAESDFGTLSSTEDCLILNPVELGSSATGHDVTAAANTAKFAIYFTGRLGRINSDGKKVVHAMMFYVGCT
jgi:hypothetical protein